MLFLLLLTISIVSLSGISYGQDLRLVIWKKVPDAVYYDGNIYHKNKIYRFRTRGNTYYAPVKSAVEVLAVKGPSEIHRVGVYRWSKTKALGNEAYGDSEFEYLGYEGDPKIDSKEIAEIMSSDDIFVVQKKAPPTKADGEPIPDLVELSSGLLGSQENLLSEGVLGRFEGEGIGTGGFIGVEGAPGGRSAPVIFKAYFEGMSLATETEEIIDDSIGSSREQSIGILRLYGRFLSLLSSNSWGDLRWGMGLSYEKLPFFEIQNEESGKGELTTKSSVGLSFGMQNQILTSWGIVTVGLDVLPISGNTKSLSEVGGEIRLDYPLSHSWSLFLGGLARYQHIRYHREDSANDETSYTFPKTINTSYRGLGGFTLIL